MENMVGSHTDSTDNTETLKVHGSWFMVNDPIRFYHYKEKIFSLI